MRLAAASASTLAFRIGFHLAAIECASRRVELVRRRNLGVTGGGTRIEKFYGGASEPRAILGFSNFEAGSRPIGLIPAQAAFRGKADIGEPPLIDLDLRVRPWISFVSYPRARGSLRCNDGVSYYSGAL